MKGHLVLQFIREVKKVIVRKVGRKIDLLWSYNGFAGVYQREFDWEIYLLLRKRGVRPYLASIAQ